MSSAFTRALNLQLAALHLILPDKITQVYGKGDSAICFHAVKVSRYLQFYRLLRCLTGFRFAPKSMGLLSA